MLQIYRLPLVARALEASEPEAQELARLRRPCIRSLVPFDIKESVIDEAFAVWAEVLGLGELPRIDEQPLSGVEVVLGRLRPWLAASRLAGREWPLVAALPLSLLVRALEAREPSAAYLQLRDAAEGVARAMWVVLGWEVLELSRKVEFVELTEAERNACRDVLERVTGYSPHGKGGFTFGATQHVLTGGSGAQVLMTLTDRLCENGLSLIAELGACKKSWQVPMERLVGWRNRGPGHGFVGQRDLLAVEFAEDCLAKKESAIVALLDLYRGLADWLERVQRELHWPTVEQLDSGDYEGELRGAPAPVAFTGGGAPLWLLASASPGRLNLVDAVTNEATQVSRELPEVSWAGITLSAQLQVGPLRVAADPDDLESRPLDVAADLVEPRRERALLRRRHREVEVKPLRKRLEELIGQNVEPCAVIGTAGVGKTYLLQQYADHAHHSHDPTVLYLGTLPGHALRRSSLVSQLNHARARAGLAAPLRGQAEDDLTTEPGHARLWWGELARRNAGRRIVVIVDGLDEQGGEEELLDLLPVAMGEGFSLVLGYRSLEELAPPLRQEIEALDLARSERTLDLGAFFQTEEGRKVLIGYLCKRHRRLLTRDSGQTLRGPLTETVDGGGMLLDVLLERAERRFIYVFHFARGIEGGFLGTEEHQVREWPEADDFYARYLTWLEERAGNHPRYVRTLRRVLLTCAQLELPVNERTMVWFLLEGERVGQAAERDLTLSWVDPILRDLDDFFERRRATIDAPDAGLRRAAWIVKPDAEKMPAEGIVRQLAHASLSEFLREGGARWPTGLPEWMHVRSGVIAQLAQCCRQALDMLQEVPAQQVSSATLRYLQQRWAVHLVASDDDRIGVAERVPWFLDHCPPLEDLVVDLDLPHWIAGLRQVEVLLDGVRGAAPKRARVLRRLGEALRFHQRAGEAVAAHREDVALSRVLADLPEGVTGEAVKRAVVERTDAVRELATALDRLGSALRLYHRGIEAVETHEEAVSLCRVLAGIPKGAGRQEMSRAAMERRKAMRQLANALGKLGRALESNSRTDDAVQVHEEVLSMFQILAGLPEGTGQPEDRRAMVERRKDVRGLAVARGRLGRALTSRRCVKQALKFHRCAQCLFRILAGIPEEAEEAAVSRAVARDRKPVRELAVALGGSGEALDLDHQHGQAVKAHSEEVKLSRILAGLSEGSGEDEVLRASAGQPGAVRELAIALGRLGQALQSSNQMCEALEQHRQALPLFRILAELPEGAEKKAVSWAVARKPEPVLELATHLGRLGSTLSSNQRVEEAVPVHHEEVLLVRGPATLPEGAGQEAVSRAVEELPSVARELGRALYRFVIACHRSPHHSADRALARECYAIWKEIDDLAPGADGEARDALLKLKEEGLV